MWREMSSRSGKKVAGTISEAILSILVFFISADDGRSQVPGLYKEKKKVENNMGLSLPFWK